jgi:hypothetical protein
MPQMQDQRRCSSTHAWTPPDSNAARDGIRLHYEAPVRVDEVVLHYTVPQAAVPFLLRLALDGDASSGAGSSSSKAREFWIQVVPLPSGGLNATLVSGNAAILVPSAPPLDSPQCPHPLRLRLHESADGVQRVSVALPHGGSHVGVDAVQLEGEAEEEEEEERDEMELGDDDDDAEEAEAGGEAGGDSDGGEDGGSFDFGEEFPIEEVAALAATTATIAASSDFVRKHVKPAEYTAGLAREAGKKAAKGLVPEPKPEELVILRLLQTPLLELEIEAAMVAIEAAEDAMVDGNLIDQAVEHTQQAVEAQFAQSR